ncbi:MAG: hypothetical protein IT443_08525 [Phycisphaeraceae bacterium]|nr:hypothetical protein [Phycisphaeraceae bacterium]
MTRLFPNPIQVLVVLLAVGFPGALSAQETADPALAGPNTGAVSVDISLDVVTQYLDKGMVVQDEGLILQPDVSLTFALYESDQFVRTVDWFVGTWNSFHSDQSDYVATTSEAWFEADLYTGVAVGLPANFTTTITYNVATYPNGWADTVQELELALAYDDTELWGDSGLPALNPYVLTLFELRDENDNEDGYAEVGIEPAITILESESYPLTLSLPVAAGFGMYDYYGKGFDWGFTSVGAKVGVPLAFIPPEFGSWEASVGAHLVMASDAAQALAATGSQDDMELVGMFNVSMNY